MSKTSHKRVHRLLIEAAEHSDQTLALDPDLFHYASRVLRLRNESVIQVWNGRGKVFPAQLTYLSKKQAEATTTGPALELNQTELKHPIFIAQGLPEGDKMDWVLEKCTEMGASGFYPIQAARSVVKLTPERAHKKELHWKNIIASAAVQCERRYLPTLAAPTKLADLLQALKTQPNAPRVLLFSPNQSTSLASWLRNTKPIGTKGPIVLLIGPEGGWSPEELETARAHGATALEFSPRVLRTESFGLACLSQIVLGLSLETERNHQPHKA